MLLSQNEALRMKKSSGGTGAAESGVVRFDVTPALWRGGFKAARRHSARVRLFRRAAIAGSLLAITLIFMPQGLLGKPDVEKV